MADESTRINLSDVRINMSDLQDLIGRRETEEISYALARAIKEKVSASITKSDLLIDLGDRVNKILDSTMDDSLANAIRPSVIESLKLNLSDNIKNTNFIDTSKSINIFDELKIPLAEQYSTFATELFQRATSQTSNIDFKALIEAGFNNSLFAPQSIPQINIENIKADLSKLVSNNAQPSTPTVNYASNDMLNALKMQNTTQQQNAIFDAEVVATPVVLQDVGDNAVSKLKDLFATSGQVGGRKSSEAAAEEMDGGGGGLLGGIVDTVSDLFGGRSGKAKKPPSRGPRSLAAGSPAAGPRTRGSRTAKAPKASRGIASRGAGAIRRAASRSAKTVAKVGGKALRAAGSAAKGAGALASSVGKLAGPLALAVTAGQAVGTVQDLLSDEGKERLLKESEQMRMRSGISGFLENTLDLVSNPADYLAKTGMVAGGDIAKKVYGSEQLDANLAASNKQNTDLAQSTRASIEKRNELLSATSEGSTLLQNLNIGTSLIKSNAATVKTAEGEIQRINPGMAAVILDKYQGDQQKTIDEMRRINSLSGADAIKEIESLKQQFNTLQQNPSERTTPTQSTPIVNPPPMLAPPQDYSTPAVTRSAESIAPPTASSSDIKIMTSVISSKLDTLNNIIPQLTPSGGGGDTSVVVNAGGESGGGFGGSRDPAYEFRISSWNRIRGGSIMP